LLSIKTADKHGIAIPAELNTLPTRSSNDAARVHREGQNVSILGGGR
jgi:hypothetical protein